MNDDDAPLKPRRDFDPSWLSNYQPDPDSRYLHLAIESALAKLRWGSANPQAPAIKAELRRRYNESREEFIAEVRREHRIGPEPSEEERKAADEAARERARLNSLEPFGIPATVNELPDRIEELLDAYDTWNLNSPQKFHMGQLLMRSWNALPPEDSRRETVWRKLLPILQRDKKVHRSSLIHFVRVLLPEKFTTPVTLEMQEPCEGYPISKRLQEAFPDIVLESLEFQAGGW